MSIIRFHPFLSSLEACCAIHVIFIFILVIFCFSIAFSKYIHTDAIQSSHSPASSGMIAIVQKNKTRSKLLHEARWSALPSGKIWKNNKSRPQSLYVVEARTNTRELKEWRKKMLIINSFHPISTITQFNVVEVVVDSVGVEINVAWYHDEYFKWMFVLASLLLLSSILKSLGNGSTKIKTYFRFWSFRVSKERTNCVYQL